MVHALFGRRLEIFNKKADCLQKEDAEKRRRKRIRKRLMMMMMMMMMNMVMKTMKIARLRKGENSLKDEREKSEEEDLV